MIAKLQHRRDIDGLRAVAVLAVVLYHAKMGCPSGFVGVDVFFVISGFLITSLIWRDLEQGCFTFSNFCERRARRILPTLFVVTFACLVAGWFLPLPADFENLEQASSAQVLFATNIHYWRDSGYFAGAADQKPLLHTWSLAVEEQFYMVVPFLLWGFFRFAALRQRRAVASLLGVFFILSFVLSVLFVAHHPTAAFYRLPTRAWELLLGSLIVFLPSPAPRSLLNHRAQRELIALVGLALIVSPVLAYTSQIPFLGLAALPPCLCAGMLIWVHGLGRSSVSSLISTRPFVFVGLISYSLYLWHWPFLAFSKSIVFTPLPLADRAALLGVGFLFAILSWKYVETPFLQRRLAASRRALFSFVGGKIAAILGAGLLCTATNGFEMRFPLRAQEFASAVSDRAFLNELTAEDVRPKNLTCIGVLDPTLRPTVLVWGDSHATAALPAVDAFLKERGLAGRAATRTSTAPVARWPPSRKWAPDGQDTKDYNDAVLAYVQQERVPGVVVSAFWSSYTVGEVSNAPLPALLSTIRRLVGMGSRPWVLLDVPLPSFDVPKALAQSVTFGTGIESLYAKPTDWIASQANAPKVIAGIEAAGGRVLDPKPMFLYRKGERYIVETNGVVLYRDEQHLTAKGAKAIRLPFPRDSLALRRC